MATYQTIVAVLKLRVCKLPGTRHVLASSSGRCPSYLWELLCSFVLAVPMSESVSRQGSQHAIYSVGEATRSGPTSFSVAGQPRRHVNFTSASEEGWHPSGFGSEPHSQRTCSCEQHYILCTPRAWVTCRGASQGRRRVRGGGGRGAAVGGCPATNKLPTHMPRHSPGGWGEHAVNLSPLGLMVQADSFLRTLNENQALGDRQSFKLGSRAGWGGGGGGL